MAYFVAFRVERSKFVWLILLTIPFWTSYLLRVFAWKVILGYNGVINSGLMALGLIHQPLEFLLYNHDGRGRDAGACLGRVRDPADLCVAGKDRPLAAGSRGRSRRRAGPPLLAHHVAAFAARRDRRGRADLRADDGRLRDAVARRRHRGRDDRQRHRGAVRQDRTTGRWARRSRSRAWRRWASSSLLFVQAIRAARRRGVR